MKNHKVLKIFFRLIPMAIIQLGVLFGLLWVVNFALAGISMQLSLNLDGLNFLLIAVSVVGVLLDFVKRLMKINKE